VFFGVKNLQFSHLRKKSSVFPTPRMHWQQSSPWWLLEVMCHMGLGLDDVSWSSLSTLKHLIALQGVVISNHKTQCFKAVKNPRDFPLPFSWDKFVGIPMPAWTMCFYVCKYEYMKICKYVNICKYKKCMHASNL